MGELARKVLKVLLVENCNFEASPFQKIFNNSDQSVALSGTSFNCVHATSCNQAITKLAEGKFDVIILDLSLKDVKALEGYYLFRAVAEGVPIVMLADYADEDLAKAAVDAGAEDYLIKQNIEEAVLLRTIIRALNRKQYISRIEQEKLVAERKYNSHDQFLMNISFEIRRSIAQAVQALKQLPHAYSTDVYEEHLGGVQIKLDDVLQTMDDILDFSCIEKNKLELQPAEFPVRESIERIAKLIIPLCAEKHVEFVAWVSNDVPERLFGDLERIGQLLYALGKNALRFSVNHGGVLLIVQVEGKDRHHARIHFAVTVSGQGIPISEQELIFESFAQADTSTVRKYGAMGLNLAVCSQLVRLMKGKIWVNNHQHIGTAFHFVIPLEYPLRKRQGSSTSLNEMFSDRKPVM